jgi:hypothetical protein
MLPVGLVKISGRDEVLTAEYFEQRYLLGRYSRDVCRHLARRGLQ